MRAVTAPRTRATIGRTGARYRVVVVVLAASLAGAFLLATGLGAVWISPGDTLRLLAWKLHLTGRPAVSMASRVILFQLRLPRVFLAMVVGEALAVAGTVF